MNTVVVTGADGFVGSHLTMQLSKNGVRIYAVVLDVRRASFLGALPGVSLIECNLDRISELPQRIAESPEVFFHLAWDGTSGEKRSNYALQLDNVRWACSAVEVAASMGCKRFVHASSIMEWECKNELLSTVQPQPNEIYAMAKTTASFMSNAVAARVGIEFVPVVISNIYGPGEVSERLISTMLKKILAGERIALTEGYQPYDFVYVTDAARAFCLAAERGKSGTFYYLSGGNIRPLREFLEELGRICRSQELLEFGRIPYNGTPLDYTQIDTDALRRDTGFTPDTSFLQGIEKTLAWLKNPVDLFKP